MKFKYLIKILTFNNVKLNNFERSLNSLDDKNKVKKLRFILKLHYPVILTIIISSCALQIILLNNGILSFNNLFLEFIVIVISILLIYLLVLSLLINQNIIEVIDKYEEFYEYL